MPIALHLVSPQVSSPSYRSIDFFRWQSAVIDRQTMTGPTRTEPIQSMRHRPRPFRPWETETEDTNEERGPVTLPPFSSFASVLDDATDYPPEDCIVDGLSARTHEENKASVMRLYHSHIPCSSNWSFDVRRGNRLRHAVNRSTTTVD
jgi:hypothetical protein